MRYAPHLLRRIRHDAGYALTFTATIALGIGAATSIFSAVDGVLLRQLPYRNAERLVALEQVEGETTGESAQFSFQELADYRARSRTVDRFIPYGSWTYTLNGAGDPIRAPAAMVTSAFFDTLGLHAQLGRAFSPDDDAAAAAPAVVLTDGFWRRAFGANRAIVGRTVQLSSVQTSTPSVVTATIVGVLAAVPDYAGAGRTELYANYAANPYYTNLSTAGQRDQRVLDLYARLRSEPGVSLAAARAELEGIAASLRASHPSDYPASRGLALRVTPWRDVLVRDARMTLLLLLSTVILVLAVAFLNAGNLFLTSLLRRHRELAVRRALGASTWRLRRDLIVEHVALAVGGSLAGLALARLALTFVTGYTALLTARSSEIAVNGTVFGVALAAGLGGTVVLGVMAPLPNVGDGRGLAGGAVRGSTPGARHRGGQRALVAAQVALSFVLLVGAGLLVRSLVNVWRVNLGFDPSGVVVVDAPSETRVDRERNRAFFDDVAARVRALPGVDAVATATTSPLDLSESLFFRLQTDPARADVPGAPLRFAAIGEDYFELLRIPILAGRAFSAADTANAERSVVINGRLAELAFPGTSPIGRRISWALGRGAFPPASIVVGVAGDVHAAGPRAPVQATVYQPASQVSTASTLLIRADDPARAAREAVSLIHQRDASRLVTRVQTLADALSERNRVPTLNASLFGGFAVLALALAVVGVGGACLLSVRARSRELGLRMALGSSRGRIFGSVLGDALAVAAVGIVCGAGLALAFARSLGGLLFRVAPLDGMTFTATSVLLLVVVAASAWLPARQAASIDPAEVLRSE